MAAQKVKGLEILLYAGDEVIGGQRNATLSMSADDLDTTDKTTEGYKTFLVGLKEWSVSCDGIVCAGDVGYEALVDAFLAGNTLEIELKNASGSFSYKGTVAISSLDYDAAYDDVLTYSCELKGASALTKVAA